LGFDVDIALPPATTTTPLPSTVRVACHKRIHTRDWARAQYSIQRRNTLRAISNKQQQQSIIVYMKSSVQSVDDENKKAARVRTLLNIEMFETLISILYLFL
jgi:hypothetical protein